MYIIHYRYKVRKKDLSERNKIMKDAARILKKHGEDSEQDITLYKHGQSLVTIVEIIYYSSKKEFMSIKKKPQRP